jgi:uncharacterized protein YdeI (YjbR/CyaY-like superfamily)
LTKTANLDQVEVASAEELRGWLKANHTQEKSIWLVTYKKHVGVNYVSVAEILDEILCFGWIDGTRRKLDENRTMQLISPRRKQHWAKSYKVRADRLIACGLMHPTGLTSITESKRKGLWDVTDEVDQLIPPEDLATGLSAQALASQNFSAYPISYRRNILRWIKSAKKPLTRSTRIAQVVATSSKNERLPQM